MAELPKGVSIHVSTRVSTRQYNPLTDLLALVEEQHRREYEDRSWSIHTTALSMSELVPSRTDEAMAANAVAKLQDFESITITRHRRKESYDALFTLKYDRTEAELQKRVDEGVEAIRQRLLGEAP